MHYNTFISDPVLKMAAQLYMKKCTVKNCDSNDSMADIKFHTFPSDSAQRQQWVIISQRPECEIKKYSKMCSLHFAKNEYAGNGYRLKKGAIPSFNPLQDNSVGSGNFVFPRSMFTPLTP